MQRSQNRNLLPRISTPVSCRGNQGRTINGSKLKFKWQFKGNYCGNTGNGSGSLGLGWKRRWNLTANAERLSHPPCDAEKPRILLPGKKNSSGAGAGNEQGLPGKSWILGDAPQKKDGAVWSHAHQKRSMNSQTSPKRFSPPPAAPAPQYLMGWCKWNFHLAAVVFYSVFIPSPLGFGGMGLVRMICCSLELFFPPKIWCLGWEWPDVLENSPWNERIWKGMIQPAAF